VCAGLFVHNGAMLADETIEEGRLAHVGSTNKCDDWHADLAAVGAGEVLARASAWRRLGEVDLYLLGLKSRGSSR